jgi:hypothetical protein
LTYKWALPYDSTNGVSPECLVLLNPPICVEADWTRSNHLGNTRKGQPSQFVWPLPYFPSNTAKKCVFRIRYNITTDDYDPFGTDSSSNNQKYLDLAHPTLDPISTYSQRFSSRSAVRNNPSVNIGLNNTVPLNVNTAQFGRVFQVKYTAGFLLNL